jgi:hypothetical protein
MKKTYNLVLNTRDFLFPTFKILPVYLDAFGYSVNYSYIFGAFTLTNLDLSLVHHKRCSILKGTSLLHECKINHFIVTGHFSASNNMPLIYNPHCNMLYYYSFFIR